MESENQQCKDLIIKIVFSLLLFMVTYMLVLMYFKTGISDFSYHAGVAENFRFINLKTEIESGNTYFMWPALVSLLHRGKVELQSACAVITGLSNAATLYITMDYIKKKIPKLDNIFWMYFGAGLLFVGPLFFPWINSNYYLGTWSPNTWHNPTNIMVKPFALLSVILILDILEKEETEGKKLVFLACALVCSVIAKPSFLQGIAPSLALYVLVTVICTRKLYLRKYLLLAASFIPAVCIMLFQLWLTFYSGNTVSEGMAVSWLRTLKHYVDNVWVALLACTAFPLFVIAADIIIQKKDIRKNTRFILMTCYLLCGWSELAFLYEKGDRESHSNFAWGYMLSVFIAFVLSAIEFLEITDPKNRYGLIVKKAGIILFSGHLLFGVWYVCNMLQGGAFY